MNYNPDESQLNGELGRKMRPASHVFLVGKPRSGTSVVREILNNSPSVAIVSETHAFDPPNVMSALLQLVLNRPAKNLPIGIPPNYVSERISHFVKNFAQTSKARSDEMGQELIDGLDAAKPQYWKECRKCASHKKLVDEYLSSERNCKDFLELVMRSFACGKPINGEKTPAHIHFVPTLLSWFPESKVIHVVRDVRGVFESQKRKWETANTKHPGTLHRLIHGSQAANEIYSLFCTLVTWLRVTQLDRQFSRLYSEQYYLLRYEDLIRKPESTVRDLCTFLGSSFDERMLDHSFDNTSFGSATDTDERQNTANLFPGRGDRWRKSINPWSDRIIQLVAGRELRRLGYMDDA